MSVRACASHLENAARAFLSEWQTASEHWRDTRAKAFAKDWMEQLPPLLGQSRLALEELDSLLKKIKDDCE